jgi:hypothetical protein
MSMKNWSNDNDTENYNRPTRKNCPTVILSTINPTNLVGRVELSQAFHSRDLLSNVGMDFRGSPQPLHKHTVSVPSNNP